MIWQELNDSKNIEILAPLQNLKWSFYTAFCGDVQSMENLSR